MKKPRVLKFLASIKLAVVVIIALGTMTAWGTFVEAKYNDAEAAAKIVYHSPFMFAIMGLFAVNLIAVMVDRWPWNERHTGFILAHIGLLLLMLGAVLTMTFGLDGSMTVNLGETAKQVIVGETDLTLYSSMDASSWRPIDDREVDFFRHRPTEQKPYEVRTPQGSLKILKYYPYAIRDQKIVDAGDTNSGAGLRFQIQNANVSVTEWLLQPAQGRLASKDLGPAQIILGNLAGAEVDSKKNTIVLTPDGDGVKYEIHTAREPKNVKHGIAKAGDTVETGWMGLVLRVLKYIPHAREQVTFNEIDQATPLTSAAILVEFKRDSKTPAVQNWIALNSMLKLFTDQAVYVLTFANRRVTLPFEIKLQDFHVGRYQGTMKAASYESVVSVQADSKAESNDKNAPPRQPSQHTISMNEPMKTDGLTFYQSSFNEDDRGRPTASVFSVNRDPGRWVKYLGCLSIVFGSIHLFYFKRKKRVKASPAAAFPVAP